VSVVTYLSNHANQFEYIDFSWNVGYFRSPTHVTDVCSDDTRMIDQAVVNAVRAIDAAHSADQKGDHLDIFGLF
jgi:hypothetical protein